MKKYKISITINVQEQTAEYNPAVPLSFSVTENVPVGTNPIPLLAKRASEELQRHAKTADIDWQAEDSGDDLGVDV